MILSVSHRNVFRYGQPVSLARHSLHLTPRSTPAQICHRQGYVLDPQPEVRTRCNDFFGNIVDFISFQTDHRIFSIEARSVVEITPMMPPVAALTPAWEEVRDLAAADLAPESLSACEFSFDSPYTRTEADLDALVLPSFSPGRPILEAALDLTARIYDEFTYDPTATTLTTPVAEVLQMRRGVCQDFAHLQIACLRRMGLPARYVSGYLLTYPPPGGKKLVGSDASHAWLSIWCPGSGWVDLDPTNNKIPSDEHITLAWGRDYGDVSPIRGVIVGGAAQVLEVAVDVNPVDSIDAMPPVRLVGAPA